MNYVSGNSKAKPCWLGTGSVTIIDKIIQYASWVISLRALWKQEAKYAALGIRIDRLGPCTETTAYARASAETVFLLQEKGQASPSLGGTHFDFKPYHFGPYDKDIYSELENLTRQGWIEISFTPSGIRQYRLTPTCQEQADRLLEQMDARSRKFVQKASLWILEKDFFQLVQAIYRAFPHMAENSVFQLAHGPQTDEVTVGQAPRLPGTGSSSPTGRGPRGAGRPAARARPSGDRRHCGSSALA